MVQTHKASGALATEKSPLLIMVEATVRIIEELVALMALEIEIISARKNEEHRELLQRKQRLTMDYRANIKTLTAEPELLKQLPADVLATLKAAGQKLADVTDRNAKFLRGAVLATQRLIQNIVAIVKKEVLPQGTYRNPADTQSAMGGYSPTCKPVAVNRTA